MKLAQALAACIVLMPASFCEAASKPPTKPLPPLVAEVPAAATEDMWERYPAFFARFKDVWLACPVELELKDGIKIARWYNDNTAMYNRMIATCTADAAHKPSRSWPPTQAAAKMRVDRFFVQQCDNGVCRWVQTK